MRTTGGVGLRISVGHGWDTRRLLARVTAGGWAASGWRALWLTQEARRFAFKLLRTVVHVERVLVTKHVHQRLPLQAVHREAVPRLIYDGDLHPATVSIRHSAQQSSYSSSGL